MATPKIVPAPQPDGWISDKDFRHMKSLGMNDPQEYERLMGLSADELEKLLGGEIEGVYPSDSMPTLIVVDDFFNNPDDVRDYALGADYVERGYHGAVGHRTLEPTHFKGVRQKFESLLHSRISDGNTLGGWSYATNGVFQHCMAEDPFVIHADDQRWAAMVYLTPDAPVECGTTLYRHKETGKERVDSKIDWDMFKGNFYDPTPFEVVDVVGNKYNRMILFDAKHIHAASQYFGDSIENDRIFQLYFFNTEDQ